MGVVDLPEPRIGPASKLAPKPIKFVLNWGRRYSLWVFNFGLACCAIEFIATSMSRHDFIRLGVIPFAPGPRQADLMVVSGTVSDKMAPAVKRLYEQMPEPKYVISFGACSNCGGPYWDSYCVTKGVDQIIPVDVYVPGCPPRPEALLHGIIRLQEKIATESLGDRYAEAGESMSPPPEVKPKTPTPAVFRRPLALPPMPEPEEIEASEERTQSLHVPEVQAEAAAVRPRDLSPAQQEQVEAAEETVEVPVIDEVDETAVEETQRLPPPEEVARESTAAETQVIPPVEEARLQAAVQEKAGEVDEADETETESEGTAGTSQLPSAEEVQREAAAFEDTQEFLPGQEATIQDVLPKESTQETRRDLPPAEEVRKAVEEKTRRRKSGRLRRFAEPPPVDAVDDPDFIPGFRDDD